MALAGGPILGGQCLIFVSFRGTKWVHGIMFLEGLAGPSVFALSFSLLFPGVGAGPPSPLPLS